MGDGRGFLTLRRATPKRLPVEERIAHSREFYLPLTDDALRAQGARCMECGVPFCQSDSGCPVQNVIPEWNDLVHSGRWKEAADALHSTNNFPEFTGRLCPAPCESACVLSLIDQPVAIRSIEQSIADRAFLEGWAAPRPPRRESGRRVAIVGSGPAGLAAAQQLRRSGHAVTVFERDDRFGGLLRYGIPDFKLEKSVLDRRLAQLAAEGVVFRPSVTVGETLSADALRASFDAVCLAVGASHARDLVVSGRRLSGIHMAMEYLTQQNRRIAGDVIDSRTSISARGKHVVIIGGGDTGSDCAGTAIRQGAKSVRQFELLPMPPESRAPSTPWPLWPMQLRSSHAHEEGAERDWSVATSEFAGEDGQVRALRCIRVDGRVGNDGRWVNHPVRGSDFTIEAGLVLLAMGFDGAEDSALLRGLGVRLDRGRIAADGNHSTSIPGIFTAGDAGRGASLIVWAIREGRDAAAAIDRYLSATLVAQ